VAHHNAAALGETRCLFVPGVGLAGTRYFVGIGNRNANTDAKYFEVVGIT